MLLVMFVLCWDPRFPARSKWLPAYTSSPALPFMRQRADRQTELGGHKDIEKNKGAVKQDSLAEWSKALASGASPQGRGFEPHSCQNNTCDSFIGLAQNQQFLAINHKQYITYVSVARYPIRRACATILSFLLCPG